MSEESERRARWLARLAYQQAQDAALAGDDAAATALRTQWEPIRQVEKEGPDVGERDEAGSQKGQRIN